MIPWIQIGFLPITLWDLLDILIVGFLLYQVYKLVRGTIAFNIVIGVLSIYIIWWIVEQLEMDMLSKILNSVGSVAAIALLIVFQSEIRRFLTFLGNSALKSRFQFFDKYIGRDSNITQQFNEQLAKEIERALLNLSKEKIGALIVLSNDTNMESYILSGTKIEAITSSQLIETIFQKESPLHDGAIIITNQSIQAAGCILPVSDSQSLPKRAGLRHRSAVGVTEHSNASTFIVSEETGKISYTHNGELFRLKQSEHLFKIIAEHIGKY